MREATIPVSNDINLVTIQPECLKKSTIQEGKPPPVNKAKNPCPRIAPEAATDFHGLHE
jgi:hypothetical protein